MDHEGVSTDLVLVPATRDAERIHCGRPQDTERHLSLERDYLRGLHRTSNYVIGGVPPSTNKFHNILILKEK